MTSPVTHKSQSSRDYRTISLRERCSLWDGVAMRAYALEIINGMETKKHFLTPSSARRETFFSSPSRYPWSRHFFSGSPFHHVD